MPEKELGVNPKDSLGSKKPSLGKVSPIAMLHESHAMMDGAGKYGPWNWRDKKIQVSVYLDACLRHIEAFSQGENYAEDSGCHHLGHARACLGILLDALETGNVVDDRPETNEAFNRVLKEISEKLPAMFERHKEFKAKQEAQKNVVVITSPPLPPAFSIVPASPSPWPFGQQPYMPPVIQTSDPLPQPATITCNNSSEEIPF